MTYNELVKSVATNKELDSKATIKTLKSMGVTDRILNHLDLPSFAEMEKEVSTELDIIKRELSHIEFNSLLFWGSSLEVQEKNLFDCGAEDYENNIELFFAYSCLDELQEALKSELVGPYTEKEAMIALMTLNFEISEKIQYLEN